MKLLRKIIQSVVFAHVINALPAASAHVARALCPGRVYRSLLLSPSANNAAAPGMAQLYNRTWACNRRRHGVFTIRSRQCDFRVNPRFPRWLSTEFPFVDARNNLDDWAEDQSIALACAKQRACDMDGTK
jgi:hypothetical protein